MSRSNEHSDGTADRSAAALCADRLAERLAQNSGKLAATHRESAVADASRKAAPVTNVALEHENRLLLCENAAESAAESAEEREKGLCRWCSCAATDCGKQTAALLAKHESDPRCDSKAAETETSYQSEQCKGEPSTISTSGPEQLKRRKRKPEARDSSQSHNPLLDGAEASPRSCDARFEVSPADDAPSPGAARAVKHVGGALNKTASAGCASPGASDCACHCACHRPRACAAECGDCVRRVCDLVSSNPLIDFGDVLRATRLDNELRQLREQLGVQCTLQYGACGGAAASLSTLERLTSCLLAQEKSTLAECRSEVRTVVLLLCRVVQQLRATVAADSGVARNAKNAPYVAQLAAVLAALEAASGPELQTELRRALRDQVSASEKSSLEAEFIVEKAQPPGAAPAPLSPAERARLDWVNALFATPNCFAADHPLLQALDAAAFAPSAPAEEPLAALKTDDAMNPAARPPVAQVLASAPERETALQIDRGTEDALDRESGNDAERDAARKAEQKTEHAAESGAESGAEAGGEASRARCCSAAARAQGGAGAPRCGAQQLEDLFQALQLVAREAAQGVSAEALHVLDAVLDEFELA